MPVIMIFYSPTVPPCTQREEKPSITLYSSLITRYPSPHGW